MKKISILIILTFITISCSNQHRNPSAIIGEDNRMMVDPQQFPYQGMATKLSFYGANGHCTGSSHMKMLSTNAHCIIDKREVAHSDFEFIPAYDSGRKPLVAISLVEPISCIFRR